ncbi:MAG: T9SS type A sorting domain-containing protein [Crocinitomicaceae bacterium]|nr:T9SS type A sorting domain-containing protein [Crocinitomicaceae bacterium]
MRKLLLNLYVISAFNLQIFSQTQVGNNVGNYITEPSMVITNSELIYLSFCQALPTDQMHIQEKVGDAWIDLPGAPTAIFANVDQTELHYSETNQTLHCVFEKSGIPEAGIYVISYDGLWSDTLSFLSPNASIKFKSVLDTANNIVYVLANAPGFSFLKFDLDNETVTSIPPPPTSSSSFNNLDFVHNGLDGFLYASLFYSGAGVIVRFNGTNWNFVTSGFCYSDQLIRSNLEIIPSSNYIALTYVYDDLAGFKLGMTSYNCAGIGSNVLLPLMNVPDYGIDLRGTSISPIDEHIVFGYSLGAENYLGYYYNGEKIEISHTIPMDYVTNLMHSSSGELYWIDNTTTCKVFKLPAIYASAASLIEKQIQFFPNPASNFIYTKNSSQSNYVIYDVQGKLVLIGSDFCLNNPISVAELKDGNYFISILHGNGTISTEQLIIKH